MQELCKNCARIVQELCKNCKNCARIAIVQEWYKFGVLTDRLMLSWTFAAKSCKFKASIHLALPSPIDSHFAYLGHILSCTLHSSKRFHCFKQTSFFFSSFKAYITVWIQGTFCEAMSTFDQMMNGKIMFLIMQQSDSSPPPNNSMIL